MCIKEGVTPQQPKAIGSGLPYISQAIVLIDRCYGRSFKQIITSFLHIKLCSLYMLKKNISIAFTAKKKSPLLISIERNPALASQGRINEALRSKH